jgi:hypothetical protein
LKTIPMMLNRPIMTAIVVLLLAVTVPMLAAQEPEPDQQTQVSEAKLEAVAKAYVEVVKIQSAYQPRIERARSAEEAQQIEQEATEQMVQAIENVKGVTVQEYNDILTAAQRNEPLRQQLAVHIHKVQQENEKADETSE